MTIWNQRKVHIVTQCDDVKSKSDHEAVTCLDKDK